MNMWMKIKSTSKCMKYGTKSRGKTIFLAPAIYDFSRCTKEDTEQSSIRGETKARVRMEEKRQHDDAERLQIFFAPL